jgi:hypothetical protein
MPSVTTLHYLLSLSLPSYLEVKGKMGRDVAVLHHHAKMRYGKEGVKFYFFFTLALQGSFMVWQLYP